MKHTVGEFRLAVRARLDDIRAARRRCDWLEETRAQRRAVVRALTADAAGVGHWCRTSGLELAIPLLVMLCIVLVATAEVAR
jgi:hypothetical protein